MTTVSTGSQRDRAMNKKEEGSLKLGLRVKELPHKKAGLRATESAIAPVKLWIFFGRSSINLTEFGFMSHGPNPDIIVRSVVPVTSTVCLIAKNEGPYLVEWLAYYRVLGFDEIVIYENNSEDNSSEILCKLGAAGKVVHRPWKLGSNESPQLTAYQDAFKQARTDWMLFVDADEFLVLHQSDTVQAFLAPLHARSEVTSIGVNWRIFGDSHMEAPDGRTVVERFTMAALPDFAVNGHIKSFTRVNALRDLVHMHACDTTGMMVHPSGKPLTMTNWGLSDIIELDVAQVNHYYTKTVSEYQIKRKRGQGGAGDDRPELKYWYNDESFHGHNRNDVEDLSGLRLYDDVRREVECLNRILRK